MVYSPECEDFGNLDYFVSGIFKVVGGIDEISCELVMVLYVHVIVKMVLVANCEIVEVCKILENIYCLVNIVMVNELKVLFD